ncbi:MAG: excinuclease ABC subunit UvrC [Candidatus Omnitrophica bacterium]|nr:excinuclease ABC subunit UvrC [Candidatus Omnitrophota bacterium]
MAQQAAERTPLRQRIAAAPRQPGVYLFRGAGGALLYVGKALDLRKRLASYVRREPALSPRIARMMRQVAGVEVRVTASEAEALLLENQLIKQHQPRYNVSLRDDKTYPLLKVTNEPFPRLVVTRRKLGDGAQYFGPYTEAGLMHEAVRFMRRVFPLRTCKTFPKTPCLEYHLGQCLAPCAHYIDGAAYQRIVDDLAAFLRGERDQLLKELARRMEQASRHRRFEEAARLRDQIQALTSVIVAKEKSLTAGPLEQLQAALKLPALPRRIEGFDISNLFGQFAVGSMVVCSDGRPHKAHYRRFKIKTVQGSDDFKMMQEVIRRRYSGSLSGQLPLPDLILVDGGKGQLSAACEVLAELRLAIPAMGLAKRLEEIFVPGQPQPITLLPTSPVLQLLQRLRDEAHRFAITYHRKLRAKALVAPSAKPKRRGR